MQTIFTIGTKDRHDEDFIALMKEWRIDAVIDVRLRNEGRFYRFASGKHIKALVEANGIAYRHDTRFSPSDAILDRYKADDDWPVYEVAYNALIETRAMPQIWREVAGEFQRPCLLCAEDTAEKCHRRLLAEALVGVDPTRLKHL